MSLAYAPRVTRSTYVPAQRPTGHGRHAKQVSLDLRLPVATTTVAATMTAVVLGLSLIGAEVTPKDVTGSVTTLPVSEKAQNRSMSAARSVHETVFTTAAHEDRTKATSRPTVKVVSAPKAEPIATTAPAVTAKPATKEPVRHATKPSRPAKAAKAAKTVKNKAHEVRTDRYFGQFARTDAQARKHNAALIIGIGKKRGLSNRSIAVAIATSIQESGLRNLDWGDRDSLGLYQQRPSVKAWGTAKQILDPSHAINQFYDRLVRIPNRDKRAMIDVAMQIQIPSKSAYHATWQWDSVATHIVDSYGA